MTCNIACLDVMDKAMYSASPLDVATNHSPAVGPLSQLGDISPEASAIFPSAESEYVPGVSVRHLWLLIGESYALMRTLIDG